MRRNSIAASSASFARELQRSKLHVDSLALKALAKTSPPQSATQRLGHPFMM